MKYVSRKEWGAKNPPKGRFDRLNPARVQGVVIHHSGVENGPKNSDAVPLVCALLVGVFTSLATMLYVLYKQLSIVLRPILVKDFGFQRTERKAPKGTRRVRGMF